MDKETVKRLFYENGGASMSVVGTDTMIIREDKLEEFAQACFDWQKEQCGDLLSDALQSDLEHGVKWLNEKASKEFHEKYPALTAAIIQINAIRNAKESPESDIEQNRRLLGLRVSDNEGRN